MPSIRLEPYIGYSDTLVPHYTSSALEVMQFTEVTSEIKQTSKPDSLLPTHCLFKCFHSLLFTNKNL